MDWIFKNRRGDEFDIIKNLVKLVIVVALIIYIVIVAQLLLFGEDRLIARDIMVENRQQFINTVPLDSIKKYIKDFQYFRLVDWMNNIVGNVLIFMPVGLFMTAIYRKSRNFFKAIFIGALLSGTIETIQLKYNLGVFDVDDIILNTFGYMLGYLVFLIAYIPFKKKYYKQNQ